MADELFSVEGRTAIITGASTGIGAMIARALTERGARTYLVSRNAAAIGALQRELEALGHCQAITADVSTAEGRTQVLKSFCGRESELHVLINNAGALSMKAFDVVTEGEWDGEYSINVKAPFFLAQALIELLRRGARPGRPATIINIGSVGGLRIRPRENYAYQSSKAALHHLTLGLARHLGPESISANAIAPGTFPTAMTPILSEGAENPKVRQIMESIPLRRLGAPSDIAGAVIFLCSLAGSFVNGAIIPVDGGLAI